MSIKRGTAGKTLRNKLIALGVILLVVGIGGYLLIRVLVPFLAPAALLVALFLVLRVLSSKEMAKAVRAVGKGYVGEVTVGRSLEQLPTGWRVFHDLDLGGENVDHLYRIQKDSHPIQRLPEAIFLNPRVLLSVGLVRRRTAPD